MNSLKWGRFDIHFHRRAEQAEDLFNFLISVEKAESNDQQPLPMRQEVYRYYG